MNRSNAELIRAKIFWCRHFDSKDNVSMEYFSDLPLNSAADIHAFNSASAIHVFILDTHRESIAEISGTAMIYFIIQRVLSHLPIT